MENGSFLDLNHKNMKSAWLLLLVIRHWKILKLRKYVLTILD